MQLILIQIFWFPENRYVSTYVIGLLPLHKNLGSILTAVPIGYTMGVTKYYIFMIEYHGVRQILKTKILS